MADSSDIDAALVMKLSADAALLALMPNGVYWDEAPPNSTRFVIVSMVEEADAQQFEKRSFEDALYMVKAVSVSTVNANMKGAAARIDELLENGTLSVNGYSTMTLHRENRIRTTEIDEVDTSIKWFHRGGQYRVVMST